MEQKIIPTTDEVSELQLRTAVMAQLNWNPDVIATDIGVTVADGIVTLSGYVDTDADKQAAEHSAKSVFGVRALVSAIQVRQLSTLTDEEIARNAVHAIETHVLAPASRIMLTVRDGWIRLEGRVDWLFEREAAESALHGMLGIRGISNEIEVLPHRHPEHEPDVFTIRAAAGTVTDEPQKDRNSLTAV